MAPLFQYGFYILLNVLSICMTYFPLDDKQKSINQSRGKDEELSWEDKNLIM
jgi:hypothetical protein